jgi:hypothetical protein
MIVAAAMARGLDTLPSSYAIHPSAWKGSSANFAFTEFSEVQYLGDTQRIQRYI